MSEDEFDSLRACLTDRCYCAEFVKGGLGGCPEITLQCWEHADHTAGCPACILCDYLDSMDIKLWKCEERWIGAPAGLRNFWKTIKCFNTNSGTIYLIKICIK